MDSGKSETNFRKWHSKSQVSSGVSSIFAHQLGLFPIKASRESAAPQEPPLKDSNLEPCRKVIINCWIFNMPEAHMTCLILWYLPSGYLTYPWWPWKMAHRNRWFSQLETSIYKGFSMAMLNNQMVYIYILHCIIYYIYSYIYSYTIIYHIPCPPN